MYSLDEYEKSFVKEYIDKNDLMHFISEHDWKGFWGAVDTLGRRALILPSWTADAHATFIDLFLTTCYLTGVDCHKRVVDPRHLGGGSERTLCIPDCVEEIGDLAFSSNKNLRTIYLSPSARKLGENVFWECPNIEEITLSREWEPLIKERIESRAEWAGIWYDQLEKINFNYI